MDKNVTADKKKKKRHSLAAKTVHSTVLSCVIFGLVAQLVALTFYAASSTNQLIDLADGIAHQAAMSASHGTDVVGFSDRVMDTYYSLSDDELEKNGSDEYRQYFSDVGMEKGGTYDVLVHMLGNILESYDVYDVYIATYDEENCRIVYVVDSDEDEEYRLYPGEWEPVNRKGMERFLNWDGKGKLYDIDWTDKYGLLCTVGLPIRDDSGKISCFMLVDVSVDNVLSGMAGFAIRLTIALVLVTILIAWLQTRRIKKTLVRPINQIADASLRYVVDRLSGAENNKEHFAALDVHTGDELEELCIAMRDMERELTEYESNITQITAEKERISTELSLATKIQYAMLPHIFPPYPERTEFDIYATMEPAREVGGDFYDFFFIDDDHLCLVMADVSGKGIPAALFMMISKTILQSCAMLGVSVAEILAKTNEAICSNNQAEMFVTVWQGVLELSTGKLTAANAGHEYPVIKRADGAFEFLKDKHGLVIGGMEGSRYKSYELTLCPGDKLFLYTDGVPEATDANEEMFGNEGMLAALNTDPDASPETILKNVRSAVSDFVKDAEQFDDLTMLCIEYRGKDAEQK